MQAINRPFNQLINGNTQFFIPVFQRDFTWGEDQCRQFWQDIGRSSSNANSPSGHFLGSFVYVGSNRPATNFPGISVDSNRVDRLVEKVGLGVEP